MSLSEDVTLPAFTGRITAIVTGEAEHPDPATLTREECAHLGINEETGE